MCLLNSTIDEHQHPHLICSVISDSLIMTSHSDPSAHQASINRLEISVSPSEATELGDPTSRYQALTMCKDICEILCRVPSQAYKAAQSRSSGRRWRGARKHDLMQMVVRGYEGPAHKDQDRDHTASVAGNLPHSQLACLGSCSTRA